MGTSRWGQRGGERLTHLTTGRSRSNPMCLNLRSEKAAGYIENSGFESQRLDNL